MKSTSQPNNRMHIIGGKFRGRRLQAPEGKISRPTLGRVREALFNILAPRIMDTRFADVYAGVGAIGLEALSRGSRQVKLVESGFETGRRLRENAEVLDPEHRQTEVILRDAVSVANGWIRAGERFDIVFFDPPYQAEELQRWQEIALDKILTPEGMAIWQYSRKQALPEHWAGCVLFKIRHYGKTTLGFYCQPTAAVAPDGPPQEEQDA